MNTINLLNKYNKNKYKSINIFIFMFMNDKLIKKMIEIKKLIGINKFFFEQIQLNFNNYNYKTICIFILNLIILLLVKTIN